MLPPLGELRLWAPIGFVTICSPTAVLAEVYESPDLIIMKNIPCLLSIMARRSMIISLMFEVPKEERLFLRWRRTLKQDFRWSRSMGGFVEFPMALPLASFLHWSKNNHGDMSYYFWRGLHILFKKMWSRSSERVGDLMYCTSWALVVLTFGTIERGLHTQVSSKRKRKFLKKCVNSLAI